MGKVGSPFFGRPVFHRHCYGIGYLKVKGLPPAYSFIELLPNGRWQALFKIRKLKGIFSKDFSNIHGFICCTVPSGYPIAGRSKQIVTPIYFYHIVLKDLFEQLKL
jgi:hypothetical protein